VNSQPTAGSAGVTTGPGTMMKGYWEDAARLLVMTTYVSVSPTGGGVVRAVVGYQRISNRPGYLVDGSTW
jgi:hypothetical protein